MAAEQHDPRVQRVVDAGARAGVEVRARRFPEGTHTAGDAARAIGCTLAQIVKTLVFVDGDGEPVAFLVSGASRLDPAKGAAAVKFLNTGQACICPNRMLVQRGIAEQFTATMEERFAKLQAGSGFTDGVTVGPLIDAAALAKMERQVADALDKGARLVTGGERLTADGLDAGCFYAPTLLADVTPADDGTLDPTAVARNLDRFANLTDPEETLGRWLYEYASYALFLARPQLLRAKGDAPPNDRPRLSQRVAEILDPIVPIDPSSATTRGR